MKVNVPYPNNGRCQRKECNNISLEQQMIVVQEPPDGNSFPPMRCPLCGDVWQECENHGWHYNGKNFMNGEKIVCRIQEGAITSWVDCICLRALNGYHNEYEVEFKDKQRIVVDEDDLRRVKS